MPEKMSANRARDSRETVRRKRRERTKENLEFYECIRDIVSHPAVLEMKKYYQHCDTDCYEHCLDVAYNNYKICKKLGLDARSAARGGMLHDLFLYDWREHSKETGDRLHAITHPITAYRNACKYFHLFSPCVFPFTFRKIQPGLLIRAVSLHCIYLCLMGISEEEISKWAIIHSFDTICKHVFLSIEVQRS